MRDLRTKMTSVVLITGSSHPMYPDDTYIYVDKNSLHYINTCRYLRMFICKFNDSKYNPLIF